MTGQWATRRRRGRNERGATAVIVALMAVVLFGAAALGIDVSMLDRARQDVANTLDSAAQAGAYDLPGSPSRAVTDAKAFARKYDPTADPSVQLWCVVASTGADQSVNTSQIPSTCYPGPGPYTSSMYPGLRCDGSLCAIPCNSAAGAVCNAIQVSESKTVDFSFAPVIGIKQGSTGTVESVACKGSCGQTAPNPLNVVVVADRTASMSQSSIDSMVGGIKNMLTTMTPSLQYVALGTINKAYTSRGCRTESPRSSWTESQANWVNVPFSDNYLTTSAVPTLNSSDDLVHSLDCLKEDGAGYYGTQLAAAMKGAARYLLGYQSNNLSSLPARTGSGTVHNVIIFETDGMPDEVGNPTPYSALYLSNSTDPIGGNQTQEMNWGNYWLAQQYGNAGCANLDTVAQEAKDAGVLIVTIAYGDANRASCYKGGSWAPYARDALAAAASPNPTTGAPSVADNTCSTPAQVAAENSDGDYYFCAANGNDLAPIFASALNQVTNHTRFIKLP